MPARRSGPTSHLLPYGQEPYCLAVTTDSVVVSPNRAHSPLALGPALANALSRPIDSPRLRDLARPGQRVLIVVSDDTRDDPRAALLAAIIAELPTGVQIAVAVANGTHGPCEIERLRLGTLAGNFVVINHDAFDSTAMRHLGTTARGTPVVVNTCVVDADVIVATGTIKPHYFAGYGAGIKSIFPGLGENAAIRTNHELKREPDARAGVVLGNPCRDDLEEVLAFVPPVFLLNLVRDEHGAIAAAVAGHAVSAFRAGARVCGGLYRATAPVSRAVVVSDELPVTATLYQACKLVAAAAPVLADRGTVIVVAECADGTGPIDVVNHGIYELGLRPRLPPKHRVVLVSSLSEYRVSSTFCAWAPSVEAALAQIDDVPTIIPRAAAMILEPTILEPKNHV